MRQSLTAATNLAKDTAPYKTGRLRRSIHNRMLNVLEGEVSTATSYAAAVEFGTKAHLIVPKRAKVLAFKKGGKTIFAKRVWHPGFPGRFYMKKTTQHIQPKIREIYKKALDLWAQYLLGQR